MSYHRKIYDYKHDSHANTDGFVIILHLDDEADMKYFQLVYMNNTDSV